jgi:hypothetical protein
MNFDNDGISFRAEFPNGYAIRKLVDFFKDAYGNGEWIFSAKGIWGYSNSEDLFSYFEIDSSSIPNFRFECPPPPAEQYCRFCIDFATFNNHIKTVTKKKKVALIKNPDSVNLLLEYDGDKSSATWIAGRNEKKEYIQEPNNISEQPTCSIVCKDLKGELTKFSTLKIPIVKIEAFPRTILMQGVSENGTDGYVKQFGLDVDANRGGTSAVFAVSSKILKKIAKMSDITNTDGVAKLWGQGSSEMLTIEGQKFPLNPLLKFQCSIGNYGEIRTYAFGQLVVD